VVVFIIKLDYFYPSSINPKRDAPITGYKEASGALAIASHKVSLPTWNGMQFVRAFHVLQEGQNFADLIDKLRGQPRRFVFLQQAPQALVLHTANFHLTVDIIEGN